MTTIWARASLPVHREANNCIKIRALLFLPQWDKIKRRLKTQINLLNKIN
jgi:hypothetical protein